MENIEALLHNDWIEECQGPWGSMIVLAPKPHQEHVTDIKDFIWRMCVSYRKLNSITEKFEYPIPRCDDAVTLLGICNGRKLYIISLDAKQGYHQVKVRKSDIQKLAFFAPNGKKYGFKVMPFGPTNAPTFYTCMMYEFKDDWVTLFFQRIASMSTIDNLPINVTNNKIHINNEEEVIDSKIIIDDILLFSTRISLLLIYLDCVCTVFQKYRCSFQLKKCEFFKDRVEYVGHDILSDGNCPAQSKFDMINNWPLPSTGSQLHSFIGLINFYHKYHPCIEIILKPLRLLERKFRRQTIPSTEWTPQLTSLFEEIKLIITSSPMLARFDPSKPCFLKTDWSALGMGWILMQPDDSPESKAALKKLLNTGDCDFDLTTDGPRLKPIAFGSRSCSDTESHFHSFVGEICSGRFAIAQNKRYLWGAHFYWFCDCSGIKEVLNYSGSIHMICRWSQELLGYDFTIIHRPASMMVDVDSLSRRYTKPIATHLMITSTLKNLDKELRPKAYKHETFTSQPTKIKAPEPITDATLPICTSDNILTLYKTFIKNLKTPKQQQSTTLFITSSPVKSYIKPIPPESNALSSDPTSISPHLTCLCFDDILGSTLSYLDTSFHHPNQLQFFHMFSSVEIATLFSKLFPKEELYTSSLSPESLQQTSFRTHIPNTHIADFSYSPLTNLTLENWIKSVLSITTYFINSSENFLLSTFWINTSFINNSCTINAIKQLIFTHIPENWTYSLFTYNASNHGSAIAANRICCSLFRKPTQSESPLSMNTPIQQQINPNGFSSFCLKDHELKTSSAIVSVSTPFSTLDFHSPLTENQPKIIAQLQCSPLDYSTIILDTFSPAIELKTIPSATNRLEPRFCIAMDTNNTTHFKARFITNEELLAIYTHDQQTLHNIHIPSSLPNFDLLLICSIPCQLRRSHLKHIIKRSGLFENSIYNEPNNSLVSTYLVLNQPSPTDWTTAYENDPCTSAIMNLLISKTDTTTLVPADIPQINPCYHQYLKLNAIYMKNNRLILRKDISIMQRALELIIVPKSLQRTIFLHFHSSPSGGHSGEYRTLHRIKLRFIWPKLREDVKTWSKTCAECVAANAWRSRKQEMYFSWPTTIPFWIMHIDLWSPGETLIDGHKGYLLNAMCDLTQFVISSPTYEITAGYLAQLFTKDVILSFGMCAVIVIDAASSFKGLFKDMCEILGIQYWPLSRGNHKGLSVERYHRFLNKVQTIQGAAVGTHTSFDRIAKTSQYAWNSAPIDNTDIVRSLPAVGREFRFPLDINLSTLPTLNDNNNTALYEYLRDVSDDSIFATSVLQILIEERRISHRNRMNESTTKSPLKVGDIVKAHVQIQSKSETGIVDKLSYAARGPFKITKDLGYNSFEVAPYHNPNGATRKYKGTELYLLPPSLFPSNMLDTLDQKFLNYDHAPVVSPLKQALQIESYNAEWFDQPKPPTEINIPLSNIDKQAFQEHSIPSLEQLCNETPLTSTTEPTYPTPEQIIIPTNNNLHSQIINSKDKLFFIKYTPLNTLRPKWYLVQVDLNMTQDGNLNPTETNKYYCSFLAKHPGDINKNDQNSRWWPDWYEFTKDENDNFIFGKRILFRPSTTPDPTKYVLWAEPIDLSPSSNYFLHGPFNFKESTPTFKTRNIVPETEWDTLIQLCQTHNLTPPINKITQNPTRKRKRKS